jgi:hypothetical protein
VSASIVRITGKQTMMTMFGPAEGGYTCTGFVIAENVVMAAAHCIGTEMTADGAEATLIKKSTPEVDLAVIAVQTHKRPLAIQERRLERFQEIHGIGYEKLTVSFSRLELDGFTPDYEELTAGMFVMGGYIDGMSGGQVIDHTGNVIGIVQRGLENVGYGVGILQIRAFLLGVDQVAQEYGRRS